MQFYFQKNLKNITVYIKPITIHSSFISERCECLIAFALIVSYARSAIGAVILVQTDQLCSPLHLCRFGEHSKQNVYIKLADHT